MRLDILLPLYAPPKGWEKAVVDAVTQLQCAIGEKCEIHLFITNDGAADHYYPEEALKQIADVVHGRFAFLKYDKNRGKGYSLRHLVRHSEGDFIIYTDGDFPFGWEAVAEVFESLCNGSDVIMGRRSCSYAAALTPFRKMLSSGVKLLNRFFCGLPEEIQDTQAGLKGFNRRGRECFLKTTVDTFVFDTEFILLAKCMGLKIVPLDVHLSPALKLSSMGVKVLLCELLCFAKVLWRVRIKKCYK